MSKHIRIEDIVLKRTDLSIGAKALYGTLASHCRHKETQCYPSQTKLAERCGVCTRTIIRWQAELVSVGLVNVRNRPNRSSVYSLLSGVNGTDNPVTPKEVNGGDNPVSAEPEMAVTDMVNGSDNLSNGGDNPVSAYINELQPQLQPQLQPKPAAVVENASPETEKTATAEALLKAHAIGTKTRRELLSICTPEEIEARCKEWDTDEKAGVGVLVTCLREHYPLSPPKRKAVADERTVKQWDKDAPDTVSHLVKCPKCGRDGNR